MEYFRVLLVLSLVCFALCQDSTNSTGQAIASRCSLPPEVGNCRAAMSKYFFNSTSQECQAFTYGGCGGNKNRFDTVEECKEACNLKTQVYAEAQSFIDNVAPKITMIAEKVVNEAKDIFKMIKFW